LRWSGQCAAGGGSWHGPAERLLMRRPVSGRPCALPSALTLLPASLVHAAPSSNGDPGARCVPRSWRARRPCARRATRCRTGALSAWALSASWRAPVTGLLTHMHGSRCSRHTCTSPPAWAAACCHARRLSYSDCVHVLLSACNDDRPRKRCSRPPWSTSTGQASPRWCTAASRCPTPALPKLRAASAQARSLIDRRLVAVEGGACRPCARVLQQSGVRGLSEQAVPHARMPSSKAGLRTARSAHALPCQERSRGSMRASAAPAEPPRVRAPAGGRRGQPQAPVRGRHAERRIHHVPGPAHAPGARCAAALPGPRAQGRPAATPLSAQGCGTLAHAASHGGGHGGRARCGAGAHACACSDWRQRAAPLPMVARQLRLPRDQGVWSRV